MYGYLKNELKTKTSIYFIFAVRLSASKDSEENINCFKENLKWGYELKIPNPPMKYRVFTCNKDNDLD